MAKSNPPTLTVEERLAHGLATSLDRAARSAYHVGFWPLLVRTINDNILPFVVLAVVAGATAFGAHFVFYADGLPGLLAQVLADTCQRANACGDWAYMQGGLAAGLVLIVGSIVVIALNVRGDLRQMQEQRIVNPEVLAAALFLAQFETAPMEVQREMLKRLESGDPYTTMELRDAIAEIRDRQAEQKQWMDAQLAEAFPVVAPSNGRVPSDAALGIADAAPGAAPTE